MASLTKDDFITALNLFKIKPILVNTISSQKLQLAQIENTGLMFFIKFSIHRTATL